MAELPVILQTREADEMPLAYCSGEIFVQFLKLGTCGAPGLCRLQTTQKCLLHQAASNRHSSNNSLSRTHISGVAMQKGLCNHPECAYAG